MNKSFAKAIAAEVAALNLRVRRAEAAIKGVHSMPIEMDAATKAMFDRLIAAINDAPEAETETVTANKEAPTVARTPRAEKPATVAAVFTPKPTPKAAATEAKPRRKLSELSMDELRQRVEKRGGNIERILKGKHARARNKALVAWLVANKKQAAQASA